MQNTSFAKDYQNISFTKIIEPSSETGWFKQPQKLIYDDKLAQISFTSGTEGAPKGILLSHRNLANTIERLNALMGLDSTIREYVGIPVFHSFGLGRVRACASVGGQSYIPASGFNPVEIVNMLKADQINAISAVPTLWRTILNNADYIGSLGEKVRWIEIGSQYMSRYEKEQMKLLFPNSKIIQHYGLTEASRSTFLDISNTEGPALESVGRVIGQASISLTNDGLIKVKGEHVAKEYLIQNNFLPLQDQEGWHTTNDMGIIKDGHLYFKGRADDVINCGGIKISPDIIEDKLCKSVNVSSGIAIARIPDPMRGDGILVAIEPIINIPLKKIQNTVDDILQDMGVKAGNALHVIEIENIPRTQTGKVQRKLLSEYLQEDILQKSTIPNKNNNNDVSHKQRSLMEIWQQTLKIDDIQETDSFLSLGGDSLSFITISIEIEDYLGHLPDNWEALSIADLEKLTNPTNNPNTVAISVKKVWITLLLIFSLLIIGEIFLQVRSYIKTGRSAFSFLTNQSTTIFNAAILSRTYRPHLTIKDISTNKISMAINSYGLRSSEIPLETVDDEIRIAIVGASTVAGAYATSNDRTFPSLLEQNLKHAYGEQQPINVINGGVEGLGLDSILNLTEGLIYKMNPSIIVIYAGFNDITSLCHSDQKAKTPSHRLKYPSLPNWVMTKEMIRKNTTALRTKRTAAFDLNKLDTLTYGEGIERLVKSIKAQGITPVLMTVAKAYTNVPDNQKAELAASSLYYYYCLDLPGVIKVGEIYNAQIRQIAKKYNIAFVDLEKDMPGGREYFVDGGHFTYKGETFVAKQLNSLLTDEILGH